ncbi:MAG: hypothetical protein HC906_19685 [Bacteroidales bacterium]|nr:hypothetical protein [Bacteroidales bacterium]
MKNTIYFLISCLMISSVTFAQTLNNPKDENEYYIVKWDCSQEDFASSNDMESDETFTFAIDVTGTPFEEWLNDSPTTEGATRALAINKWTDKGGVSEGTNRLKQIDGNIYGATWNLVQMATTLDTTAATTANAVVTIYGQVFGYEFTGDNPGVGWWMWPASVPEGTAIDPAPGQFLKLFLIQVRKRVLNSIVMILQGGCFSRITFLKEGSQFLVLKFHPLCLRNMPNQMQRLLVMNIIAY